MKRIFTVLSLIVLTSCTSIFSVGPDYEEPVLALPDSWVSTVNRNSNGTDAPSDQDRLAGLVEWWKGLDDPALSHLISVAREKNYDLESAKSRVLEARAALQIATAGFFPSFDGEGSWSRRAQSSTTSGIPPGIDLLSSNWSAGLTGSWEIDVFGGTRRTFEAARATVEASEADLAGVYIALLADVARSYITIRALEKRLEVSRKNLQAQQENLEIVEARFNAGLVSELDVAQARTLLGQTRALVPELESARRAQVSILGVLLAALPSETDALLAHNGSGALLTLPATSVPMALPSELLRRRPDVWRAERILAAQTAAVGVATADLFPRFSISGSFGQSSEQWGSLFDGDSRAWSFIPGVRLPIFHAGSILGNIDLQESRTAQALSTYQKTVLAALSETESALTDYQKQQERKAALIQAWQSSERALELSKDLYREGVADFQRVLDAERSALAVEDAVVRSEQDSLIALVTLYRVLGGGWDWNAAPRTDAKN